MSQMEIGTSLPDLEEGIDMLFDKCESIENAISVWAALDTALSKIAASRISELGGDADLAKELIDGFFLLHPLLHD